MPHELTMLAKRVLDSYFCLGGTNNDFLLLQPTTHSEGFE